MQIFISYKREDEIFARSLHNELKSWGYVPWLDVVHIPAGEPWDSAIHRGLRDSEIVIGILTANALASGNVLDEWGYALSTEKRLILLWLTDVIEADVPPRYIRIQRIDLRHNQQEGLLALQRTLASAGKIIPEPIGISTSFNEPERPADVKPEKLITQSQLNRKRMLEKVYGYWIHSYLEESVHKTVLIDLDIQTKQGVVDNPWDTVLQHGQYGDYRLPAGTKIDAVYHDLNSEMLILGDPGSGKTTTLLELARDLIKHAQADDAQPIPVIFNLSSWADDRKPLAEWLSNELTFKYGAPKAIAKEWIETNTLILLLDGLDEVNSRYREECVTAINAYREENGFTRIVVCSRTRDYEALSTRLRLNGAVVLQPLNMEQIDKYLSNLGPKVAVIRQAMINDPTLRELAESPLMLSIMTLAYQGATPNDLPKFETVEEQRAHLFNTYVQRMFLRNQKPHDTRYPQEQTLYWLSWLARKMVEKTQTVFLIEGLQPHWLNPGYQQKWYALILRVPLLFFGCILILGFDYVAGGLTYGLLGGIIGGVIGGLAYTESINKTQFNGLNRFGSFISRISPITFGLDSALKAGVTGGLIGMVSAGSLVSIFAPTQAIALLPGTALIGCFFAGMVAATIVGLFNEEEAINTVESLQWSLKAAIKQFRKGMYITIAFIVLIIVIYSYSGALQAGVTYAFGVFLLTLMIGVVGGVNNNEMKVKILPNQGIFQSGRNALIWGGILGSLGFAIATTFTAPVNGLNAGLKFGLAGGLFAILGTSFLYGGATCLKHFILRCLLYHYGYIPWNYAKFLDHAARLIFLRKVGGGYIFIHRLLLEHFAAIDMSDPQSKS